MANKCNHSDFIMVDSNNPKGSKVLPAKWWRKAHPHYSVESNVFGDYLFRCKDTGFIYKVNQI